MKENFMIEELEQVEVQADALTYILKADQFLIWLLGIGFIIVT
jgi:hypothetical protein